MIEINNLTTNPVDEEFLRKVAQKVLQGENKNEAGLSIALIGQGRMRKINKRHRGKNRITDVLAFPETKVLLEKFKVGPVQKTKNLGEIIICLREVNKNAKKYQLAPEKELARILIHGLLHLSGYDHEKNEAEEEKSRKKEEGYLLMFYAKN